MPKNEGTLALGKIWRCSTKRLTCLERSARNVDIKDNSDEGSDRREEHLSKAATVLENMYVCHEQCW